MNDNLLKKILLVMLVVFIFAALAGVVIAGLGEEVGIVVVIVGVAACFPVLGELSRMSAAKKTSEEDEKTHAQ